MNPEMNAESDNGAADYLAGRIPGVLLRDLISAEGPDTATFLHALLSQDIASMAVGDLRWAFLLQPQGRLVAHVRVRRVAAEHFELDTELGAGEMLYETLRRYLLRTKCTLSFSPAVQVLRWHRPNDAGPAAHPRLADARDEFHSAVPASTVADSVVDGERIAAGLASFGQDIDDSTIPNSTGLLAGAVAFGKGCYVGQELVERIDSRGATVPWRLVRLDVTSGGSTVLARALPLSLAAELTVTSVGIDPGTGSFVALGRAMRSVEVGTDFVDHETGVTFRVAEDLTAPRAGESPGISPSRPLRAALTKR